MPNPHENGATTVNLYSDSAIRQHRDRLAQYRLSAHILCTQFVVARVSTDAVKHQLQGIKFL